MNNRGDQAKDGVIGIGSRPKIAGRIESLEQRLKQLKARQQRAQARARTIQNRTARREETRRKVLVGAIVLARVEQGLLTEAVFRDWLDAALLRQEDRTLFGLSERARATP
jgi:hypothetical protein